MREAKKYGMNLTALEVESPDSLLIGSGISRVPADAFGSKD